MLKCKTIKFELFKKYFIFKNNKNDKNYSFHEYLVYHIYHGNFIAEHLNNEKTNFVGAYNQLKQSYLESNKQKLTEDDRIMTSVYFDLMKEIRQDYTKTHMLSLLVIDANKKFGWSEFDPSQDAKTISAMQSIKNWSSNSNKLISTIGKYISEAPKEKLNEDDSLYSGIIDSENIENQKPCLFQKLSNLSKWKQFNEIGLTKQKMPFNQHNIKACLDKNENEIEKNGKQLVRDLNRFFKRWDQAQSLSAKDRGARKFGDVIRYFTGSDKNLYKLFFVEVSYGPFHQDPEPHIDDDKKKLEKP
ncbi:10809_t:CDS:2, partial [Dentiscutata heterogama]